MTYIQEEWKPVVGFENLYEVSSLRKVRNSKKRRMPSPYNNRKGYLCVGLVRKGRTFTRCVHKLVATAFLGDCPDGFEVNHKDADRANPTLSNLEYVTHVDNLIHTLVGGR